MDDVEICLFNWKSRYDGNIMSLDFCINKNKYSNKSLKVLGHLISAQSWKCKVMLQIDVLRLKVCLCFLQ